MNNPFHAQGPTNPKHYANRKLLIQRFRKNVFDVADSNGATKPNNFAIVGKWGVGKTSTLYKFRDMLGNELKDCRAFCVFIEIKPAVCENSDKLAQYVISHILREMRRRLPANMKIKNFINEEITKWHISKLSLMPELERREIEITATSLHESLVRIWKTLNENSYKSAVIMLDDIQYIAVNGKHGMFYDLRTDIQSLMAEGARYIFVTTSPENIQPTIQDAAEPFTRLFEKHILEPFDITGTREMILNPIEHENISLFLDDGVIAKIHEFTGGHPYFISLIMREIVDKKVSGRITAKEFNSIYPDLTQYLATVKFDDDFAKASDEEKKILLRMGKSKNELVSRSEMGYPPNAYVVRLLEKDLLVKAERGEYKLYHKLFREYLKRK